METKETKDLALEACSNDIKAILEKYGCQIVCQPQVMFGQTVYVPVVTPKQ